MVPLVRNYSGRGSPQIQTFSLQWERTLHFARLRLQFLNSVTISEFRKSEFCIVSQSQGESSQSTERKWKSAQPAEKSTGTFLQALVLYYCRPIITLTLCSCISRSCKMSEFRMLVFTVNCTILSQAGTTHQSLCLSLLWFQRLSPERYFTYACLAIQPDSQMYWNLGVNWSIKYKIKIEISISFCCTIIYYDIWNQLIVKFLSNHDMVW